MDAGWLPDPQNPSSLRYWDGLQWTAHVAPAPQPHPQRRVRPTAELATPVIWLAVAETVLNLVLLPFSWGDERSTSFPAVSLIYGGIAIVTALIMLAEYVVTCLWLWRARINVEELRPEAHHARSAGWIWAGWFTPFVALWFPYQIVRDIGTTTTADPSGPKRPPRLGLWWTFWILSQFAGQAAFRLAFTDEPWARRLSFEADLAVALFTMACAAAWIPIVRFIDADQAALLGAPLVRRHRRVPELVISGVAAATLLGTWAVVATAPPFFGSSPGPRFEIPSIGECRTLTGDDVGLVSNDDVIVPCSQTHTAFTYDVGFIPGGVDGLQYDICSEERLDAYVGVDHRLTNVYHTSFQPNEDQIAEGAEWYRCDAFVRDSDVLTELPGTKTLVEDSTSSPYVFCDAPDPDADEDAEFVDRLVVMCSEPHDATATIIAEVPTDEEWPGEDAASQLASDACEDALKALPENFSFSSPTEKWWTESDTIDVICYLYDNPTMGTSTT